VTERAVKHLVACGDAGHCVNSVRLGYVELVHAAYFDAAGVCQFCGGWWAAGVDEHGPILD
jgi:hypothetical protein